MTKVDQFESAFRAAAKAVFAYQPIEFAKVLVVTDLDADGATSFTAAARNFLQVLGDKSEWKTVSGDAFSTVGELLDLVEREAPDLVCTYRHLHSKAWKWSYSLGEHLDVLTQVTKSPVVVTPHPAAGRASGHSMQDTSSVMAMTDHLAGDDRLVNHAARFVQKDGSLYLAHVEDQSGFERYMEVVSKIPTIDTENARESVLNQLLKEPDDYIQSCAKVVEAAGLALKIEPIVTSGHHLREYKRLVEEHEVDLLVLNTIDEDQLAMHGLAHPLAVELRSIPLLML